VSKINDHCIRNTKTGAVHNEHYDMRAAQTQYLYITSAMYLVPWYLSS
jgi:hypothetical protein